jgi:P-type conjugative transfer protein TrbJ
MKHSCLSLAIALTAAISSASIQQASAQGFGTVYCTNCGTEWTQLANKVTMVQQLAQQAQQLQTEVGQLQNMQLNTQVAPNQVWGTAVQDFNQLTSLLQQSQALASTAGNLDQQFATRYGTYTTYLTGKLTANDWKSKYSQWSKEATDNALYTMKGLGLQSAQMQDEQALMQQLQGLSGSTQGRMQALQVANMMAAQNVDQIQKLRQLMMMQLQMQANYVAMQQDKEAAKEANRENLYSNWKNTPDTDGKVY